MIRSELQWRLLWRCWVIHHSSGEETRESSLSAGILTSHINKISTLSFSCLFFTYRSQESPFKTTMQTGAHTYMCTCTVCINTLFKYKYFAFPKNAKRYLFHWNIVTHIFLKSFKPHKKATIIKTEIQQYSKSQQLDSHITVMTKYLTGKSQRRLPRKN